MDNRIGMPRRGKNERVQQHILSRLTSLGAIILLSLAGCGGGNGSVSPSSTSPSSSSGTSSGSSTGTSTGSSTGTPAGSTTGNTSNSGTGSTSSGLGPNSQGQLPNSDGYYPDANGRYPNGNGIYPDQNGVYPSPAEIGYFPNGNGVARSFSTNGPLDLNNAFFKPFGNGRSCATCHDPADGFSITPATIRKRFDASQGNDPLFTLNDGANSPRAAVSTLSQRELAYSLLLDKGLFRIGQAIPANAEFELLRVEDPYGYASAQELSLYRRPLPSANLKFLSHVMWDGRETLSSSTSNDCVPRMGCFGALDGHLQSQAQHATMGHAQASSCLSVAEQNQIVAFEKTLFTAQIYSKDAGFLDVAGALGGALNLSRNSFTFGSNDPLYGNLKTGALFNSVVMNNFNAWLNAAGANKRQIDARLSIARGEQIFNSRPFQTSFVPGVPNDLDLPLTAVTCSSCHNTPQVGGASSHLAVSIFTSDGILRTPDLPLYVLRHKGSGLIAKTTDPGIAMQSGKWADIGRFKVPSLRGLSARAPYFHNGSAATITDVVFYYDRTFSLGLNSQEADDLIAFLSSL
ncbi:MAG: cytochrome C [Burkholderiaceae bacterium]|nr:MAG: cytochrome C [Burkholderiaceae bacterium]